MVEVSSRKEDYTLPVCRFAYIHHEIHKHNLLDNQIAHTNETNVVFHDGILDRSNKLSWKKLIENMLEHKNTFQTNKSPSQK